MSTLLSRRLLRLLPSLVLIHLDNLHGLALLAHLLALLLTLHLLALFVLDLRLLLLSLHLALLLDLLTLLLLVPLLLDLTLLLVAWLHLRPANLGTLLLPPLRVTAFTPRRIANAFALRLLFGPALRILLRSPHLLLRPKRLRLIARLLPRIVSLLTLELVYLPARISIATCRFCR